MTSPGGNDDNVPSLLALVHFISAYLHYKFGHSFLSLLLSRNPYVIHLYFSISYFLLLFIFFSSFAQPLPPLSHETLFVPLFVAPLLDAKFQGRLGQ